MSIQPAPIRVAGTAVVLRDGADGLETLLLRRPASGSFADAWVFPGGKVDDADRAGAAREQDAACRAAVRETQEEAGIHALSPALLSCWVPPPETPVRFRTWFFLAREQGEAVLPNPGEVEEARWVTPRQAFEWHAEGGFTLFPPTWMTLYGLREHASVDDAFAATGAFSEFHTRMHRVGAGIHALWQGDEEHPDAPGAAGARHRLLMDALPWRYERH